MDITATEVSNIWASYLKNSMELRFFEYFFVSAEDKKIKKVVERLLHQSKKNLNQLEAFFKKDKLTIPIGFTNEDIKVEAPKLFSDTFILYFCHDITQLSLSTYPSALSECIREDIRDYFQISIEFTFKIQNEIVALMLSKGIHLKPPQIDIDDRIDFAKSIKYLNGFFGGSRPLNVAEIANISRIIHRAQFSKMVFVTFSKLAVSPDLKTHFSKGRDTIEKVIDSLQEIFKEENIALSSSGDFKIFDVEMSPFSDKLMMFFVNTCLGIFCFTMVNQAMSSSLRSDIILKLTKITNDMKKYYGKGLILSIKENWLEQPPQAVDRKV
ncbi:DUF3231 family protein [Bacillus sp. ISL-47]|nr:DUF3231 family protein [Bacillus sp. ISL-47]MBT2687297.1 DUF3231 family protein [Bacillus sp. ISL-47]